MSITKRSKQYTDHMINKSCGDSIMRIGVHRGKKLEDVPKEYLEWAAPRFSHNDGGIDINKYLLYLKSQS